MTRNRLPGTQDSRNFHGEGASEQLLRAVSRNSTAGFMVCPAAMGGAMLAASPQMIYLLAAQRAREALRPSWTERNLLGFPN